ncbi:4-(cytidine 5'-diphospho)-2-C-methyl-D-erythritol kinase [Amorphus coralli]|uniref:4-(cytidine 5'-diphospho)-2-C-methyl-D-erythritol kinase n=1 Tax=Amorphus coralli TaxID=340680 RepID=UPI00040E4E83|nr:4-(cytidine 5'-diphospho)-2-C-methyl-D-erythritol kinase [Amorphus coralli]
MPASGSVCETARAKVNLALHVVGRRADGYHLLDSLVAFASIGDTVTAERRVDGRVTLTLSGPFADHCPTDSENLILKAEQAVGALSSTRASGGVSLHLDKQLPVASGIGGGSADAAAAIRALVRLQGLRLNGHVLHKVATGLGADVPMCLESRPLRAQGIGDITTPTPALPAAGIVLINPGVAVSTPAVFRALKSRENAPLPDLPACFTDLDALVGWLKDARNDLEPPALTIAPSIASVLTVLRGIPECRFARMSGSGATCFGLFASEAEAMNAAKAIATAHPHWWVAPGGI